MATSSLVVGGTSGIGYAMACRIAAEAGARSVIVSGRSKPQTLPHSNMEFRSLDASSMSQIKKYTDSFKAAQGPKLDLLVMTQGIFTLAGRTETPEGIDNKMALHYYGKQLLIRELLPVLQDDAKVVIVLDGKLGNPSKLNWDDLDLKNSFSLPKAADHCTTMNDAMVQAFAAKQQQEGTANRHFIHAFPGGVNTNAGKNMPWYLRPLVKGAFVLLGVAPETCAENLVTGAAAAQTDGEKAGRAWSNIDNKGKLIPNKHIWTAEELRKVEDHTWGLIDAALQKSPEA